MNEILLIFSILFLYGAVLLFYKLFDINGLYCFTVIASILANIEVLILVQAFGMEQTLGNILFASTFMITDIISETAGKKEAGKAVNIGLLTSIMFVLITQMWLLYIPSSNDWAMPHIKAVFSNTPRLIITSLIVYGIVQRFDVWMYHKWWELTTRLSGDSRKYLFIRNNGSTLISQLLNTILFTFGAFYGVYNFDTLLQIGIASYVIFIVTSLLDTPVVYMARKIHESKNQIEK